MGAPGDDLSIPLPCVDPNAPCVAQPFQGRAFVLSGASGALIRRLQPPGNEFLALGFSLARLDDLDGDGRSEIAVGAPTRRPNRFGQVFVFRSSDGSVLWQRAEPQSQALASFGQTLSAVDDVDGDGRRDLLVGAPFHDYDPAPAGYLLAGRAYLLSGATGAMLRTHDNPSPAADELFGSALSGLADETGDGIDEYAIADPVAASVVVYRGSDGALLRTITSPGVANDGFGTALSRVDDEDGDGRDDFWVSSPRAGMLYRLRSTGAVIGQLASPTPGPPPATGGLGTRLATTADGNGDGRRDLVAGESAASNGGAAYFVADNRPPVALCRPVAVAADAVCTASVTARQVDDGSFDPDSDPITLSLAPAVAFSLGTTTVTLTATDDRGASASCSTSVTVVDDAPPVIGTATAAPSRLWPPNHRLVDVLVAYPVADNCTPSAGIGCGLAVTSNEPIDGAGDGHTTPDWLVTDAHLLALRSERSGTGNGRRYDVEIRCADAAGNAAGAAVAVDVPHRP